MGKKWDAFEESLGGFPPKRRYWTLIGVEDQGVFIWEREWESLAAMEATYEKYGADSGSIATVSKLGMETDSLVEFGRVELFTLWPEDTEE